jgi:HPt (histidine-containing phosphotransfer) domain-containing protein
MFNPLVDNLSQLSDDEVNAKIRDLTKRYWQTQNPQVKQQIQVMLSMFTEEQKSRMAKQQQQSSENGDSDLDNLININ